MALCDDTFSYFNVVQGVTDGLTDRRLKADLRDGFNHST